MCRKMEFTEAEINVTIIPAFDGWADVVGPGGVNLNSFSSLDEAVQWAEQNGYAVHVKKGGAK